MGLLAGCSINKLINSQVEMSSLKYVFTVTQFKFLMSKLHSEIGKRLKALLPGSDSQAQKSPLKRKSGRREVGAGCYPEGSSPAGATGEALVLFLLLKLLLPE